MRVTLKLFAALREAAGASDLNLDFAGEQVTVAEVRARVAEALPALRPMLETVAVAVNEEYTRSGEQQVRDGDVVALIPPIAGGAEEPNVTTGETNRKSTRLNSSHVSESRMPSSA